MRRAAAGGHHDVFEDQDALGRPFLASIGVHLSIVVTAVALSWTGFLKPDQLGDPDGGGLGSVAVTPVPTINIPRRTDQVNRVAVDTESQVPSKPERVERKPQEEVEPDAIAFGKKDRKKQKKTLDLKAYMRRRAEEEERPNQVYSQKGAAASTPMFQMSGGGGVGLGNNNPFGTRFGYYAQLIRDKVARNWRKDGVPPVSNDPMVMVVFEVQRDGSVRDVRIGQSSGIGALDNSCRRAILESSPFEPLPIGFERNSAVIEFWFQLKR